MRLRPQSSSTCEGTAWRKQKISYTSYAGDAKESPYTWFGPLTVGLYRLDKGLDPSSSSVSDIPSPSFSSTISTPPMRGGEELDFSLVVQAL